MDNQWKKTDEAKPQIEESVNPLSQLVSYLTELQSYFEGDLAREQAKLDVLEKELLKAQLQQGRRKKDNRG